MKEFILKYRGQRCYYIEINGINIYDILYCDAREAIIVAKAFLSSFDKVNFSIDKSVKM